MAKTTSRQPSAPASSGKKSIAVYADWDAGKPPFKLGTLKAYPGAGRETFEFEFEQTALSHPDLLAYQIDPHLQLHGGPQYCQPGLLNFGLFLDRPGI